MAFSPGFVIDYQVWPKSQGLVPRCQALFNWLKDRIMNFLNPGSNGFNEFTQASETVIAPQLQKKQI
tara:strand:- start:287 stop:487 length:201 start_codon:yes stop_codon:yes gene_type:complete